MRNSPLLTQIKRFKIKTIAIFSNFQWFHQPEKSQPTNLTQEEIKELVSTMRQETPDEVNQILQGIDQIIESKKRNLMEKKVIDVLLQEGQSIAEKCRLNNTVRMRALTVELERAQKLDLSEMAVIETALHESNKVLQNQSLQKLYNVCQEMYVDFFDQLEMYLDLLGEPLEDESVHPLQPYTLQLLPAEKERLIDSDEFRENLALRGEKLAKKLQQFIIAKALGAIEYHYELLHVNSLIELKKVAIDRLNKNQSIQVTNNSLEKIEWQGTQKELAELFIELKRKKFIKQIPTKLIKAYFTQSNSIEQPLSPCTDKKTKIDMYEKLYSGEYEPHFENIKSNTKNQQVK